ncbi:hypothetical protein A3A84_03755 [Candidatus Collierbacteria bacterium RIFCSPLOWO2_01_FULL_50_23]|uniref:Uncharacterized protein n=2 Tax=Candidatus Collieribacteriota TaxID=1752725 RepID=A0A1F5ESU0_9BACT|nr:MAG: hypothetical protein A3D09_01475 [Candidatus Collierbacteria bacterium RIFCSPHIGHO2_02_FULL_49_10]OGD71304.1 MAG: hypothetical protein A2703_03335 [Candidatus Collierbacteria bacterium RIFCSPHIGHO2_01_FULL_50_25]OGD75285.1 MAG: hypothetical protein A3A84_03755 [Candidatus Collierbacteria bacterium RIFCSPLOWO2_01_FULL_50_23]
MITQTDSTQIKVNLSPELKDFLASKSDRYGLTLSAYVKHLILKDVSDIAYPTFKASKQVEENYQEAIRDKDESVAIDNIDEFFEKL